MNEDDIMKDIPVITLTGNKQNDEDKLISLLGSLEGPRFMHRNRPYNGQSHTDTGERGKQLISGLTIRDIRDCYIRGFINAHPYYREGTMVRLLPNADLIDEASKGEKAQLNGNDLYLLVGDIDPIALWQNVSCEIEKMMGIFPNVPGLKDSSDNSTEL